MIRLLFGFLMVYGSVGTLEVDPYAPLFASVLWAVVGLSIIACPSLTARLIVWRRRINSGD